jgi:hypothetical protein
MARNLVLMIALLLSASEITASAQNITVQSLMNENAWAERSEKRARLSPLRACTLAQAALKPSGFGMRYLHRHWPGINPPLLQTAALPAGQLMEQGGEPCAEQKL